MLIGKTPVARLQRVGQGCVFLKLETFSPNATYFDRVARALCEQATFPRGASVIEAGNGALCVAVAAQCAARGLTLQAWLAEDASIEVRQALELWGAKLTLTPFEHGPEGARAAARSHGNLLSETYPSVRIAVAHEVGRELVETIKDDGGRVDAFVAGCGSGATLSGVMSELRAQWPGVEGVAVQPAKSPVIDHGIWKPHRQPGNASWAKVPMLDRTLVSRTIDVSDEDAWAMRARLGREEGLLLSTASAASVCAAERLVAEKGAGSRIYALAVDSGERDFSLEGFFS
ncbi:MAG: pyridoxal-phosphate dependent enzyme [Myxococcaceae bacterium]|nr:pyridoxal-phosphate dependent enzyme [Myxococcaceae bacterium]